VAQATRAPSPGAGACDPPAARPPGARRPRWGLDSHGGPAPAPRARHEVHAPAARRGPPGAAGRATRGPGGPAGRHPSTGCVGCRDTPGRPGGLSPMGGVDEDTPEEPRRLTAAMARAAGELCGAILAGAPPGAVVVPVGASRMAAEGWGWRPRRVRTSSRRCAWRRTQVPSWRQRRPPWEAVGPWGSSWGLRRQAPPARRPDWRPWSPSRLAYVRGRPPDCSRGSRGARICHASSRQAVVEAGRCASRGVSPGDGGVDHAATELSPHDLPFETASRVQQKQRKEGYGKRVWDLYNCDGE
jgi:hypothetical protein